MSDELKSYIDQPRKRNPAAGTGLRLSRALPRVQGGPSLGNAPSIDVEIAQQELAASPNSKIVEAGGPVQSAHALKGPHVRFPATDQTTMMPKDNMQAEPTTAQESHDELHLDSLLACRNLEKSYHKAKLDVPVLRGVDIDVRRGEFLAIVGQSGSGKSTLLYLMATLAAPDRGEIYYDGRRIDNLPARRRDQWRNRKLGMIFQFYHLLPELNTLQNVLSPLMIRHGLFSYLRNRKKLRRRATDILELVGLSHRLNHRPCELSGGEMQRVAIARALIGQPDVLLADEPTGNLDQSTGQEIFELLRTLNQSENLTIVMVTHDSEMASRTDRTIRLVDGQVDHPRVAAEPALG